MSADMRLLTRVLCSQEDRITRLVICFYCTGRAEGFIYYLVFLSCLRESGDATCQAASCTASSSTLSRKARRLAVFNSLTRRTAGLQLLLPSQRRNAGHISWQPPASCRFPRLHARLGALPALTELPQHEGRAPPQRCSDRSPHGPQDGAQP